MDGKTTKAVTKLEGSNFSFLNPFLQLAAEKKGSKNGAARKFFGPSYFVTALENVKSKWRIKLNFLASLEHLNFKKVVARRKEGSKCCEKIVTSFMDGLPKQFRSSEPSRLCERSHAYLTMESK